MVEAIFFDGWAPLARTAILAVCGYVALVLLLRISGKRTLSKMNAFDFLVTIALGSALASVLLSKDTSLSQGVLAFTILILCQFVVTWLSVRWGWVRRWVTGEPQMLLYRGEFLHDAMKRCRVTEEELLAALRGDGVGDRTLVHSVVLETDASFSIVREAPPAETSTLTGVQRVVTVDDGIRDS